MIDVHLQALLLRQRGDNRVLAKEIMENLSPEAKQRLFRLLRDMQDDADHERSKRRRGQFW